MAECDLLSPLFLNVFLVGNVINICVNQVGMLELKWIIKFWFCSFLTFKAFHKLSQPWKSSRKSPLTLRLHSPKAYFFSLLKSCFIQHIAWEPYRDKSFRERVVRNFHSQSCCEHYKCQFSWDRMTNEASIIKARSLTTVKYWHFLCFGILWR